MLRPEGTASVVRSLINAGLTQSLPQGFIITDQCSDMKDLKKADLDNFIN